MYKPSTGRRQTAGELRVLVQRAEVGGHQAFESWHLQARIRGLEGAAPVQRQFQRENRLVDLHPLHTLLFQPLQDFTIGRQQAIQQRELVEITGPGFAQPQIGERPQ